MGPDIEALRLRRALRDLVALSTIPAAWVGRTPAAIAAGLADVIFKLLDLDFVFVRLRDPAGGASVEATLGTAWTEFPEWVERRTYTTGSRAHREIVADVGGGRQPCNGIVIAVGVDGEGGLVAAACERSDFPDQTDELLLSMAANHAVTAFQSARLIQERRHAEEAMRRSNEQLAKASRLKSEFVCRMSHELRTPMNAIVGFSDLLAEEAEGALGESYMDYVQHIREGARHLLSLINDVLDLSKIEAGRLELFRSNINVADHLSEVLSLIKSLPGAGELRFAIHLPKRLSVFADRTRLKQIFYNLLSNAVKFTPEGGTISIEAAGHGECVAIAVADTGGTAGDLRRVPPGQCRNQRRTGRYGLGLVHHQTPGGTPWWRHPGRKRTRKRQPLHPHTAVWLRPTRRSASFEHARDSAGGAKVNAGDAAALTSPSLEWRYQHGQ